MSIPKLLCFKEKQVEINKDFIDFNETKNWSPQRQIEVFWNLVKDNVFKDSLELSEEKIDKSMQAFNTAYGLVKYKFQDIERNTGGRYFDHLIRVMQYLVINSKKPTIKKTIIALCHDIIEDTDVDFDTLKNIFGTYIAFAVLIISKKSIRFFINNKNKEEKEMILKIKKSGILNSKRLLSDEFLQRKTYFPESITDKEKESLKLFNILEKKIKEKRNKDFFSHMLDYNNIFVDKIYQNTPCLNKFYNKALFTLKLLKIKLTKEEIKNICLDALEVKFWDRIDNLRTMELYNEVNEENIKKAERKISETQKYFYKIALEYDTIMGTNFYNTMFFEIEKIKNFIKNIKIEKIKKDIDLIIS